MARGTSTKIGFSGKKIPLSQAGFAIIVQIMQKTPFFGQKSTLWNRVTQFTENPHCKFMDTNGLQRRPKVSIFIRRKRIAMNKSFMDIVSKASANKSLFDSSVEEIAGALDISVKAASRNAWAAPARRTQLQTTGWLRGSLSYPWAIVCIVIPAVLDTLM